MSSLPVPPYHVPDLPPTGDELPWQDGVPMDSHRHRLQMEVLLESLEYHLRDRRDVFVGGNMFVYFSLDQARNNDFRGPDVFVVLGCEPRRRKSWVVWEEGGLTPDLVIELLSEWTEREDRGPKKHTYAHVLGVPVYILYEPDAPVLEAFRIDPHQREYRPAEPGADGRVPCERVGVAFGLWEGTIRRDSGTWLRCFTLDGELVPIAAERAEREAAAHADEARLRAEEARLRAEAERRAAALEEEIGALRAGAKPKRAPRKVKAGA